VVGETEEVANTKIYETAIISFMLCVQIFIEVLCQIEIAIKFADLISMNMLIKEIHIRTD